MPVIYEGLNSSDPNVSCIAAGKILQRKSDLGLSGFWSLAELGGDSSDYDWLLGWASKLAFNEFKVKQDPWRKETVQNQTFPTRAVIGLLLFHLEAEHARRESTESAPWRSLGQIHWDHRIRTKLFTTQNSPTTLHRELLQEAAECFSLRNVFGVEGTHEWRISINLQFGYTVRGAASHLHLWLRGASPPEAVKMLRDGESSEASHTFRQSWAYLRDLRRGLIEPTAARKVLSRNPWIPEDRIDDLMEAACMDYDPNEETLAGEESSSIVLSTRLQRDESNDLQIAMIFEDPDRLGLELPTHVLRLNGNDLGSWLRDEDGTYRWSGHTPVMLPLVRLSGTLQVADPVSNDVSREEEFDLMEEGRLFEIFHWDGRRIRNPFNFLPDGGLVIVAPSFLECEGDHMALHTLADGWQIVELGLMQVPDFVLRDPEDGQEVWSGSVGSQNDPQALIEATGVWFRNVGLPIANDQGVPTRRATLHWSPPNGHKVKTIWLNGRNLLIDPETRSQVVEICSNDLLRPCSIRFRIGKPGEGNVTFTKTLPVPNIQTVLRKTENGVMELSTNRSMSAKVARRASHRFLLPEPDAGRSYVLLEGWRKVSPWNPQRLSPIVGLAGYGAELRVFPDLFNHHATRPILNVSNQVVDGRIISGGKIDESSIRLFFDAPYLPSTEHLTLVWTRNSGMVCLTADSVQAVDKEWRINTQPDWGSIYGVGILFQGHPVGSWFSLNSWSNGLCATDPRDTALFVRHFKAPLMSGHFPHYEKVSTWINAHLPEILPAWLSEEALEIGGTPLTAQTVTEEWLSTLQDLFSSDVPTCDPNQMFSLIQTIWGEEINPADLEIFVAVVATVSRRLLDISPWLGVAVARSIGKALPGLGKEIDRSLASGLSASPEFLQSSFKDTFGGLTDEIFISHLIDQLVDCSSLDDLDPMHEFNARMALKNRTFRRHLAYRLLNH